MNKQIETIYNNTAIINFSKKLAGQDYEDIIHDAICECLRYKHTFKGGSFERWFVCILKNVNNTRLNKIKLQILSDVKEPVIEKYYSDDFSLNEVLEELRGVLTPLQMDILNRRMYEDITYEIIEHDKKYAKAREHIKILKTELKLLILNREG